jgi:hypothetical protein
MTHKRTTIRDAVVTAVETEALPHLSVYMGDEERSEESDSMSADLISAELIIEARAESTVEVDITADLMLEEVQAALAADPTFGGAALDSRYAGLEVEREGEATNAVILMTINYRVLYE